GGERRGIQEIVAALKDYYQLLEIAPGATADEVKRAFRQQIARYHPDKVQHLGKEFQAMAADRAAELTEAYRILGEEGRRSEYDRALAESGAQPAAAAPAPASAGAAATHHSPEPYTPPPPPQGGHGPGAEPRTDGTFTRERGIRDEFVR